MNILQLAIVLVSVPPTPTIDQVLPAYGPTSGGQIVTITGSNLAGTTAVSFGTATALSFVQSTSNSVLAVSPPHATGSADVVLVAGGGTSSLSAADQYTWTTAPDKPTNVYYDIQCSEQYLLLAQAATSSITVSTWNLSDRTIGAALAHAASTGVTVNVVEDLSHRSGPEPAIAKEIASAGGNVYDGPVPRTIQNNFLTIDGRDSIQGNYYLSPTAVQIGSYAATISGSNTAFANQLQYGALIRSGSAVPP